MIVLIHEKGGRVFVPEGESWQVAALLEAGYREWVKNPPVVEPAVPAVFSVDEYREEIASEPTVQELPEREPVKQVDWTKCKGVSTEIAADLYYMNLNTKDDLLIYFQANGISALTDIPGVGMKRARDIIAFAQAG
jgi:hypothetical protein